MPEATYQWKVEHEAPLWERLRPYLSGSDLIDALFARHPAMALLPDMPPRTGYVLGFFAVRRYLAARSASACPDISWTRLIV